MEFINDKQLMKIIALFFVAKLLILGAGYAGYFMIPAETTSRIYIVDNPLLNPWAQYDGRAFLDVAQKGYNNEFGSSDGAAEGNYGWFPLYPLLIKMFSFVGYGLSAFLVSNVFSLASIVLLFKLVRDEFGESVANKTVLYMLVFPTAYFFSVMYAESVFLFLTLLTFYYARKGNWLLAGIVGFLAALTRLQGILLLIPISYLYLEKIKFELKNIDINAATLLLIPGGTVAFFFYLYILTGDFFSVFTTLSTNYTHFSFPGTPFVREITQMLEATELKSIIYHMFNVFIAASFLVLSLLSFRYLRKDYSLYALASVLMPFFSSHFVSISRYVLVIFPVFIVLGILADKKKSWVEKALIALSLLMLIVLTVRHVNMHLDPYGL